MRSKVIFNIIALALIVSAPAQADSVLDQLMLGSSGVCVEGKPTSPPIFGVAGSFIDPANARQTRANEDATIGGYMVGDTGITAQTIADGVLCGGCVDPVSRDAVRGVAVALPGRTVGGVVTHC